MNTKKKALVLGGATGLLGQTLVNTLKNAKNCNNKAIEWEISTLGREDGNLFDKQFIEESLEKINPDVVFNTVAYTQVDRAETEKDLAYKVNKDFPLLLGKIINGSETSLVHYSTDFVFDGKKECPYTEEDETNPLNVYGASKLAGENALLDLGLNKCLIIRTSWLFGPCRTNFISKILDKAKNGEELKIVFDQIGSPSYTLGLASNSLALLNAEAEGIYHVSNSGRASWYEFAHEALDIADIRANISPISSNDLNLPAERPSYSVLSCEKLTSLTGINPRPWTHALRDFIYHEGDFFNC